MANGVVRPEDFGAVPVAAGDVRPEDFGAVPIGSPRPEATAGERTSAAVGGLNRGIAGLAGLPVDTAENIMNLAIAGAGSIANAAGRPDLAPELLRKSFGGSESIAGWLDALGINTRNPRPDDRASRMLHTGGTIAGGSMLPGAGARNTAAAVVAGPVAEEVAGPEWVGPAVMAPGGVSQAARAARESAATRVRPNIEAFREAGAGSPSLGQATESNFLQGMESLLSKFPGGQGVFRRFAEAQQKSMGDKTRTGVAAEDAGRAIEGGVDNFLSRTKATWQTLDNAVAAKIPKGTAYAPTNTLQTLEDLTKTVVGAEKTTGALVNPKLAEIKENLSADLLKNSGQLPFEALRQLRSRIGSMLDDSLVSGIPQGELKRVYASLSKDMEAAAKKAGAGNEWARQNAYYSARMDRVENVLSRVLGKTPEETFSRFMPRDAEQSNKLRAVMRSLQPGERQVVAEAVVNRLGRATPGKQNEAGDVFSSETFLTNWNRLSPQAKAQLFTDADMRRNLEAVAKVSANIREGAGVYANPSGTAGAGSAIATGAVAVTGSIASGSVAPLVGAAALIGGANVSARMLTSPRIVEWLAQSQRVKPERTVAHLARLGVIYNELKDEGLKRDLANYITSVQR